MTGKFKLFFSIFLFLWGINVSLCAENGKHFKVVKKYKEIRELLQDNFSVFGETVDNMVKEGHFSLQIIDGDSFFKKGCEIYQMDVFEDSIIDHPFIFPIAVCGSKIFIFKDNYSDIELLNRIVDVRKLGDSLDNWKTFGLYFSPCGFFASPNIINLNFSDRKMIETINYLPGYLKIIGGEHILFKQVYTCFMGVSFEVTIKGSLKEERIYSVTVENVCIDGKTGKVIRFEKKDYKPLGREKSK